MSKENENLKVIFIRVEKNLHDTVKSRAKRNGMTVKEYFRSLVLRDHLEESRRNLSGEAQKVVDELIERGYLD